MTYTAAPAAGSQISALKAIGAYFGRRDGSSLQDFAAEIKALSPAEKQYLAEGAAKELGCTLVGE